MITKQKGTYDIYGVDAKKESTLMTSYVQYVKNIIMVTLKRQYLKQPNYFTEA